MLVRPDRAHLVRFRQGTNDRPDWMSHDRRFDAPSAALRLFGALVWREVFVKSAIPC